jgi:hypothetical protein
MLSVPASGDEFDRLWYDGNAEISVYSLKENRYDQIRNGQRILVFVTEPLRRTTLIKPDTLLPEGERYDVLKLNDIRKFTTGIYDYSVLTSVFSGVKAYGRVPLMRAVKVSFGSQEWCGNVFEIMKRTDPGIGVELYSYFESDGEPETTLIPSGDVIFEDNLWVLIRELKGPFITEGTSNDFQLVPSSWQRRKRHVPIRMETVTISKKDGSRVSTPYGRFACSVFVWEYDGKKTQVWVEREWPRKIVKWRDADGSTGVLASSARKPYWKLHGNEDLSLRKELRIK